MKSVTYKSTRVFYHDEGKGYPVILVHGFCEDSFIWNSFMKLLPADWRIIRPDLPGFGKSALPAEEVGIETYAECIYRVIQKENISKCLLVGHSMGGYAAMAFVEKYSERLEGYCLFHSSALPDDEAKKKDRLRVIDFVKKNGVTLYINEMYPNLFALEFYEKNKTELLKLQSYAGNFTADGIIAALNAMRLRTDRANSLKNSPVPVSFIIGKKDTAVPYEKSRRQYALPAISQIALLDEVAHMGMFEAPEICAAELITFVKALAAINV